MAALCHVTTALQEDAMSATGIKHDNLP